MNQSAILSIAILLATSLVASAEEKITFDDHVLGVFRKHCLICHHQAEKKGGLALDSFLATMDGGSSGEVVDRDGDPEDSRLWQLISHQDSPVMPPGQDRISDAELDLVRSWIESGAPENSGSKVKRRPKNALAQLSASVKRPDNGGAMPGAAPFATMVATSRPSAVSAIAASPWAPLVAIAGQRQIMLYHIESGRLLAVLPFAEGIAQSLRFSRDGALLIAAGGEHSVRGLAVVYDVVTGKRMAQVGDELDTVFDADADPAMRQIALGGPQKILRIFDATDGEPLFEIKKHTDWILAVAYSPDGRLVASGDRSGGLHVWEAKTGRLSFNLAGHKGAINAVAWRDDSSVLASASEDGSVRLWDANHGKMIKSIKVGGKIAFDVDFDHQGRLVTAGGDRKAKLWEASGKLLTQFTPATDDVLEVAISHDGKRVVYGDWSGQVVSADASNPKQTIQLPAMLASNSDRLAELDQQLALVSDQRSPLETVTRQKQTACDAAHQAVKTWKHQFKAAQKAFQKASQLAQKLPQDLVACEQRIAQWTADSRDLHDATVAARVALGANPTQGKRDALQERVATSEQKLAEHLMRLAAERRRRNEMPQRILQAQAAAKNLKQQADQIAKREKPLRAESQAARAALEEARRQADEVARRHQWLQTRKQWLQDAIADSSEKLN